jgi:pyrroloquinoline-quinone synthase
MLSITVTDTMADALIDRRLLTHPFYRRWEAGELAPGELAAYAAQYRYFEAALPEVLAAVVGQIEDPEARRIVQANIDDERGVPAPHVDLFDDFARAVGAPAATDAAAQPTAATRALLNAYAELVEAGPVAALAAVAAYEVQSPEIATSKADGLRRHYGLGTEGTRFWDVHGTVDELHGRWLVDALAAVASDDSDILTPARRAADAWWAFLDEREEAAATA